MSFHHLIKKKLALPKSGDTSINNGALLYSESSGGFNYDSLKK